MARQLVLIIDDELQMIQGLKRILEYELDDVDIHVCGDSEQVLRQLLEHQYDLVLLDVCMPGIGGMELLPKIKNLTPDITVIMMTAFGNVDLAVQSIKQGASDFVCKPFEIPDLVAVLKRNLKRQKLRSDQDNRVESPLAAGLNAIVGQSKPVQDLLSLISSVAKTDYSVLVRGESGTGKELVARAIHQLSPRGDKRFVTVNCPAIPEHLLESELFGYKKGAFTGATQDKKGLFQEANGSTLLLDEVADIPISVQTKLLRVLQEQEIRPLGSNKDLPVDVRILSSTNQDLEYKLHTKAFREDLFFRLNVVTIKTPRLEEIPEDIPLLVDFFTRQVCSELNISPKPFSAQAIAALQQRSWPGNIRELQNVVRRTLVFSSNDEVTEADIALIDNQGHDFQSEEEGTAEGDGLEPYSQAKERVLQSFTTEYIHALLQKTRGNVSQAAKLAGLSRVALQKILRRTAVDPRNYRNS